MNIKIWQAKLIVLWLLQAINYTAYIFLGIYNAGTIESVDGGETIVAVFYFIPCLLIWLTLCYSPIASKWLHVGFGLIYALLKIYGVWLGLTVMSSIGVAFNEAWAAIAAGLIIWYGWKVPENDNQA